MHFSQLYLTLIIHILYKIY